MKFLSALLLFITFVFGQTPVMIDSDASNIKEFNLSYFISNTENLSFEDIKNKKFTEGRNSDSLGADVSECWVRISLHNTTQKPQILFLHQDLTYFATDINFFEVDENNSLLNQKKINLSNPISKSQMNGADAVFEFQLDPHQIKTIYVYQRTFVYHLYNFSIFNEKNSKSYLIVEKVDAILVFVFLVTLAIYNFFIFSFSRYKEYLYYSLYLFSSSAWVFYAYGALAHYFHIYGDTAEKFNYGLMFSPIFLALFIQSILDTKTLYKTEHKFLNSIIVLLFANFIYGLIHYDSALELFSFTLNYALSVFLGVSISIYKKKDKIIRIFLYAHVFYLILNFYGVLFYMGLVDFSYISSHGIGIGIGIEALILSYLVSYKFKVIEEEKEQERLSKLNAIEEQNKSKILLSQKSKMADMGEMVANIAHQWKQPLAIISVSAGILKEKKLLKRLSDEDFEEELHHIDLNIAYMSQTIEDFLNYFRINKTKERFNLLEVVNKSLLIIGHTLYQEEIKTTIAIDEKYELYGYKNEYMQVLITILTNASYALQDKDEKNITLTAKEHNGTLLLEIEDTGGGIPMGGIEKIFEPYFSTKNKSIGTGMGLYIAKTIIENGMDGSLHVVNTEKGAKFSIIV
jgi:two-component system, sensor histidine kinase LadS